MYTKCITIIFRLSPNTKCIVLNKKIARKIVRSTIIIVICICPPGALIWLINLFYSILFYSYNGERSNIVLLLTGI